MIRRKDYLRAKANKTGSGVLRQAYSQIRAKLNQKVYELRKHYYTSKIEQHKYDLNGKYLKVQFEKLIRPYIEIERLILKEKNLLIKSKLQNCAMNTKTRTYSVLGVPKLRIVKKGTRRIYRLFMNLYLAYNSGLHHDTLLFKQIL